MQFLKIIFIMSFSLLLFAEKVEISSDSMEAKNLKKEIHFLGNVKISQLKNYLSGDKVIVYFNDNNKTKMYEAIGNVNFEFIKDKSHYKGSAKRVIYYPLKSVYILKEKALIDDLINKRHINGNEIMLNMLTGKINIKGSKKKPVKFIFDMENKK